jgi:hypothetical protein
LATSSNHTALRQVRNLGGEDTFADLPFNLTSVFTDNAVGLSFSGVSLGLGVGLGLGLLLPLNIFTVSILSSVSLANFSKKSKTLSSVSNSRRVLISWTGLITHYIKQENDYIVYKLLFLSHATQVSIHVTYQVKLQCFLRGFDQPGQKTVGLKSHPHHVMMTVREGVEAASRQHTFAVPYLSGIVEFRCIHFWDNSFHFLISVDW